VASTAWLLVQEYAPIRGNRIVRVETLNGPLPLRGLGRERRLRPVPRRPSCMVAPGKASLAVEAVTRRRGDRRRAEAIARAARLDVGGVKYLIDDRDGACSFYASTRCRTSWPDPVEVPRLRPPRQADRRLTARPSLAEEGSRHEVRATGLRCSAAGCATSPTSRKPAGST
jgi:hypothetical protein